MTPLIQMHEPGQTPMPHQETDLAVGIDLGTTNSLIALVRDGSPEIIRDINGNSLVPSIVAYEDGSAIVGSDASIKAISDPERVITSIKRLMGRSEEDVLKIAGHLSYKIHPSDLNEQRMVLLEVDGRVLSPVEISADILRSLKNRAETALGKQVLRAVITVPAHFDDSARAATKDAARLAGLETLRLINEPTAAALAYKLDQTEEGIYAVYDLGGGTFDVSLLKLRMGVFQVLATGGDTMLGGDDFDKTIAEYILSEHASVTGNSNFSFLEAKKAMILAKNIKEYLTDNEDGEWNFSTNNNESTFHLNREKFNSLIIGFINKTLAITRNVINDANARIEEIKGIVLVGGATRIPLVRSSVVNLFNKEPIDYINPDEVVAKGAALQASALTEGSNSLLLDVNSLSLGIETMGGLSEKIIPRNTPIPASRAQEFTTYIDGQTAMAIHVVQGERELVSLNRSLAKFELKGIPPMAAGSARVRVTFSVDTDSLLTVSAEEITTSIRQQVSVKPSYGLSEDQMSRMLRESLENSKDDMENRLLLEARVDGERMLKAIETALASDGHLLSTNEYKDIELVLSKIREIIKTDNRSEILNQIELCNQATEEFAAKRMDRAIKQGLKGKKIKSLES